MRVSCLFFLVLSSSLAQDYTITQLSRQLLTNDSIVKLSRAGFDELFIVERIRSSRTDFDTTVEGLIALKQAGVSEDLIRVVALEDLRTRPAAIEAQPAGAVETSKVRGEKNWWGFRWVRVLTSR
jgi:hypothetical protein